MNQTIAVANSNLCSLRRVLLAVTLLLVIFSTFGQTSRIAEIDSLFKSANGITMRHPDSANALGEKMKTLSREFNYDWGLLQSRLIKGMALYQKNELDSAAQTLMSVISDAEFSGEKTFEEARARNVLGLIFQRLNSFDKARENFVRSAEIFKAIDNELYYAMSLSNIGVDYGMRGDYSEALDVFLEFRDIILNGDIPEKNVLNNLSAAISNIGKVYSFMGDYEKALDYAKQGLKLYAESGDSVSFARQHLMVGEGFAEADQLDSAIYYNQLGLDISLSKYRDKPRYTEIVFHGQQNIAEYYAKKDKIDTAIVLLLSSMRLRRENENNELEDCFTLLAQYYQALNRIDSAKYYSHEALKMAKSNRNKKAARDAAKRLTSLFVQINQFDSAYYYKSLYHSYNDSVFNESTSKKYNNLRVELSTSEKQAEIEALQKQREIDEKNAALLIVSGIAVIILFLGFTIFLIYRNRNRQIKLQSEIEKGQSALQQQALHMMNLNNNIHEIEAGLKSMKKKEIVLGKDVQSLLNNIFVNRSFDKEWEQLETHFSKIHPNFNSQLLRRHDNLTQKERRLLALVKLDLSTREIAGILSIEQRSVVMSRYRLKQKLGLEEKEDLDGYVQTL